MLLSLKEMAHKMIRGKIRFTDFDKTEIDTERPLSYIAGISTCNEAKRRMTIFRFQQMGEFCVPCYFNTIGFGTVSRLSYQPSIKIHRCIRSFASCFLPRVKKMSPKNATLSESSQRGEIYMENAGDNFKFEGTRLAKVRTDRGSI